VRFDLPLAERIGRSRRLKAYRRALAEVQALSDAELADIGLKRAYLGTIARKRAFG
jgi:uncharacterized protein YjiS (DUF1127 family)